MKRLITLIALTLCVAVASMAQGSLNIGRLFSGLQGNPNASVTCVQGRALKDYKLSLFYSLKVANDPGMMKQVQDALAKDARRAVDREVHYKDGQLHYAFYNLGTGADGLNRYILYSGGASIVLIYLEGKAKPDVINSFFK